MQQFSSRPAARLKVPLAPRQSATQILQRPMEGQQRKAVAGEAIQLHAAAGSGACVTPPGTTMFVVSAAHARIPCVLSAFFDDETSQRELLNTTTCVAALAMPVHLPATRCSARDIRACANPPAACLPHRWSACTPAWTLTPLPLRLCPPPTARHGAQPAVPRAARL